MSPLQVLAQATWSWKSKGVLPPEVQFRASHLHADTFSNPVVIVCHAFAISPLSSRKTGPNSKSCWGRDSILASPTGSLGASFWATGCCTPATLFFALLRLLFVLMRGCVFITLPRNLFCATLCRYLHGAQLSLPD